MKTDYTKADMALQHYSWDIDRRDEPAGADLDTSALDRAQGYEVLLFANTFLNLYVPGHDRHDLQLVEHILMNEIPFSVSTKNTVAIWIAAHWRRLAARRDH